MAEAALSLGILVESVRVGVKRRSERRAGPIVREQKTYEFLGDPRPGGGREILRGALEGHDR